MINCRTIILFSFLSGKAPAVFHVYVIAWRRMISQGTCYL